MDAEGWREPHRLAGWAPDDARELLVALAASDGGDLALAHTTETLAKVFAVTSAWDLARGAYLAAANAWDPLHAPRAAALRVVVAELPLAPFATNAEAIAAELDLLRAAFDATWPPPLAARALVELRRSLAPRPITGRIEAAFGLAPEDLALAIAAAAPIIDADAAPLLALHDWTPLLRAQTAFSLDPTRVLALGLVRATPKLVPHPAFASRLLGRAGLEQPTGARMGLVEPCGDVPGDVDTLATALVIRNAIAVVIGASGSGRRSALAHIARRRGRRLYTAHPLAGATPDTLVDAAIEARLHDGVLAVDLDAWRERGVAFETAQLAALAPIAVVSRDEPEIPPAARAFTMYPLGR
jgi:hypothetical protein